MYNFIRTFPVTYSWSNFIFLNIFHFQQYFIRLELKFFIFFSFPSFLFKYLMIFEIYHHSWKSIHYWYWFLTPAQNFIFYWIIYSACAKVHNLQIQFKHLKRMRKKINIFTFIANFTKKVIFNEIYKKKKLFFKYCYIIII